MSGTSSVKNGAAQWRNWVVWGLRIVLGALFLFASFAKLSGQDMMIAEFNQVGLGQWFRLLTAGIELCGAVALLIPRVSIGGACLLLLVDIGAFVAQITRIHQDWIHTLVIGALLVTTIALQSGRRQPATA